MSFEAAQSTSISASMDEEFYRHVPYRFFTNEANTDACKLEKLTNLFPDMKATIEIGYEEFYENERFILFFIELFKINNLSRDNRSSFTYIHSFNCSGYSR